MKRRLWRLRWRLAERLIGQRLLLHPGDGQWVASIDGKSSMFIKAATLELTYESGIRARAFDPSNQFYRPPVRRGHFSGTIGEGS